MSEEKTECPINGCKTKCTSPYQMKIHIIGGHVKTGKNKFDDVLNKVKDKINIISERTNFWCDLLERLKVCEPEFTNEDENNCAVPSECDGGFDLKNYFDKENPICREERQYAHFLATQLEMKIGKEFNKFGIKGILEKVYYECTFMRDYWCTNKKTYNKKLKKFIRINETNNDEIKHPNYWGKSHPYARWMTNAKPDIGLLVKEGKEYKLHFLECKYLSSEDKYKAEGVEGKSQTEVQEMILEFLCSKDKENGLGLRYKGNTITAAKEVKLVRFVNGNRTKKQKKDEIQIEISKLLTEEDS